MSPQIVTLIICAVVVLLPAVYVLAQYNALVALRNYIRESWSDVDVELKRRYDLSRISWPWSRATPRTNARRWSG
jgi:hypothetical protein